MQVSDQQRLWLIELLAWWEGRVNASDLSSVFHLTRQSASKSINQYLSQHPDSLVYNSHLKTYQPTEYFIPSTITGDVTEYLEWSTRHITSILFAPSLPFSSVTLPPRYVSPQIVRKLVQAIREQKMLEVDYVSLSNPDREGRIIAPHSFVKTGLRWHLRAWCEKSQEYRDFVLSRFRGTPDLEEKSHKTGEDDAAWHTFIDVMFAPDPRLTLAQKEVIEADYQMQDGYLRINTRACLAQYVIQEMQVHIKMLDPDPKAQQLILVNKNDISQWLF
ncbi:WYL domain-containing protein [Nitrincola tibetensis]|uniref:WYL domain-containing protein n=1 Tax=Nitrincola tibetensis TaxID=2219697 RepID=A0A364NRE0_9GAMM|nr:WYL domain-containing protein [Nitrincola tibetensis]RAU19653.1 WYL domain-containing protein [Nitrincola tibetensis]